MKMEVLNDPAGDALFIWCVGVVKDEDLPTGVVAVFWSGNAPALGQGEFVFRW